MHPRVCYWVEVWNSAVKISTIKTIVRIIPLPTPIIFFNCLLISYDNRVHLLLLINMLSFANSDHRRQHSAMAVPTRGFFFFWFLVFGACDQYKNLTESSCRCSAFQKKLNQSFFWCHLFFLNIVTVNLLPHHMYNLCKICSQYHTLSHGSYSKSLGQTPSVRAISIFLIPDCIITIVALIILGNKASFH